MNSCVDYHDQSTCIMIEGKPAYDHFVLIMIEEKIPSLHYFCRVFNISEIIFSEIGDFLTIAIFRSDDFHMGFTSFYYNVFIGKFLTCFNVI